MKKQQCKEKRPGKRGAVLFLCAAVLAIAALAVGMIARSGAFPRLEAAGYRITREEYLRSMYQARNEVLSDHAAAGISLTDWHTETALGDPIRLTADRAVEILSEYYAVSTLAVERGYLRDAGYEALLQDLEAFNRERRETLESGSMVTGLPSFTVEDYLTYRTSNIRLQFCADPDNPENQVTSEEIRQRYEADKDNLYVQPDDLQLAYLVINAAPEDAAVLKEELEALRTLAMERGLAQALEERPELKAFYEEITVDQSSYSVYARSHADILSCAEELGAGEISQVFQQEGWFCLVECLSRFEHSYAPLEEVESVVLQSIRESRYDALIEERMEEMEIEGDLEALYRFTAEQFP